MTTFSEPRHHRDIERLHHIELNKLHNHPVGEKPMSLDDYLDLADVYFIQVYTSGIEQPMADIPNRVLPKDLEE